MDRSQDARSGANGMIRCDECKKHIIGITKYTDWLSLMNFMQFLFMEDYIEEATYKDMTDKLMTFKRFCEDEDK